MTVFSNELSYEILENGYDIYLNGQRWMAQHEPYIPFPELSYEENAIKQCEELDDSVNPAKILTRCKEEKIGETHEELEKFLSELYVEAKIKDSSKKYSVTKEKQNLLSALIQKKQYCNNNSVEFAAMWNAKGEVTEEYTLAELQQLSLVIYSFVQPYVAQQQELEKVINACDTLDELNEVQIAYTVEEFVYELPEVSDDGTSAEERIAALEEKNNMLMECILEMSEVVYGG